MNARRRTRTLLGAVGTVWTIAMIVALVGAISLLVAWKGFGYIPLRVVSPSMDPALPVHTLVLDRYVDADAVRVGDVITFDPPGETPRVTHRVVAIQTVAGQRYFETKGDANERVDDWRLPGTADVDPNASRGVTYGSGKALRVEHSVPYVGHLFALPINRTMRMIALLGATLIGAAWILLAIWMPTLAPALTPTRVTTPKAPS